MGPTYRVPSPESFAPQVSGFFLGKDVWSSTMKRPLLPSGEDAECVVIHQLVVIHGHRLYPHNAEDVLEVVGHVAELLTIEELEALVCERAALILDVTVFGEVAFLSILHDGSCFSVR